MVLTCTDKTALLAEYVERYRVRTLVETGLWNGRGSGMGVEVGRYIAVDIQEENVASARAQGFDVWKGDSATIIPRMIEQHEAGIPWLKSPVLFWLDAHYVVDYDSEETLNKYPVPLLRELEAITVWTHAEDSVVLIDDVRLFGAYGWPSAAEVRGLCETTWDVAVVEDVMRCTPKGAGDAV